MLKKMQPLLLLMEQSGWVATSKSTRPNPAKMKIIGEVATGAEAATVEAATVEEEEDVINLTSSDADLKLELVNKGHLAPNSLLFKFRALR
jgi:hypothetical protein